MTFQRDRTFWAIALQAAAVNFYLGGFGPAQPLLRADQHTSLAIGGLHGTALGVAAILAGYASPRLVHAYGRVRTSWIGLSAFVFGVTMFVFSPPVPLTLTATLIAGFGTSVVINTMITRLSAHHAVDSARAVSQGIGIGSFGYILGTLAVGTLAGTTLSWRLGLMIVVPFTIALFVVSKNVGEGVHVPDESGRQRGKLNFSFWIAWLGFVTSISSEFATTFWAAALLRDRVGSSAAISTVCIVSLGLGLALGRVFGSRVLVRIALDNQLKLVILLQLIGFMTFWFSHILWLSIAALFATGLGLAMQFGLISYRMIVFSDGRPDLAIGTSSFGAGIAIGGAPFMLGLLGDHFGISRAYMMVPVLIGLTILTIYIVPTFKKVSAK
ncbi:MAG: MFS transporter [Actinobacteria bacterium]|nr:MFS transporter [Actinomycetota bacterium]